MELKNPTILFDGVCNLCSASVQFIIKRDKKGVFKFASLQSDTGQLILNKLNLPTKEFDTFILIDENRFWTKSSAALMVCGKLQGIWPLSQIFFIVPKGFRDAIYGLIAKNRYHWFGKKEACWLPTPELKSKFI